MTDLRALLDTIAHRRFERAEAQWRAALTELRLPLCYQPALRIALRKSNWRTAADPSKYLRSVACRQAERLGLADVDGPTPISSFLRGDQTHEQAVGGELWFDDSDYDPEENVYNRVDPELFGNDDNLDIDWELVGQRLGLDDVEVTILQARADGMTREAILRELADSEADRRELQAAFRRLCDRTPQLKNLLLGKSLPAQPPRKRRNRVPEE